MALVSKVDVELVAVFGNNVFALELYVKFFTGIFAYVEDRISNFLKDLGFAELDLLKIVDFDVLVVIFVSTAGRHNRAEHYSCEDKCKNFFHFDLLLIFKHIVNHKQPHNCNISFQINKGGKGQIYHLDILRLQFVHLGENRYNSLDFRRKLAAAFVFVFR